MLVRTSLSFLVIALYRLPDSTCPGVFDSVASGQLDFGIVPQENTIFGGVIETYDALRQAGDTRVVGETTLRIDHCLLAKSGVKLEDIRCVLSHEQVRPHPCSCSRTI